MNTIEIFGGGFSNKGGELMLRVAEQELRRTRPDLRLAVEARAGDPYELRARLGLSHIYPAVSLYPGPARRFLFRSALLRKAAYLPARLFTPSCAEDQLGLLSRSKCDALVDISGYAFGDGFSWIKSKNAVKRCQAYYRSGKPIIFLPQMFGPFKKPKNRDTFKQCCEYASLIYAREQASYDEVRDLIGDDPKLKIAPDITIFNSDRVTPNPEPAMEASPYACLVPNERMLDQGRAEWADSYLDRLTAAGCEMARHGIKPVVLIHAGDGKDGDLAAELKQRLDTEAGMGSTLVYSHPDPVALKAFIAGAKFLIGSRFHSLVAALSSGVPGVALGWAHKYDALANDFGVPQLLHRGSDQAQDLVDLVAELADEERSLPLRETINEKKKSMQKASTAMWEEVRSLLGLPRRSSDNKLEAQ